jgi:hypothetical protein
MNGTEKVKVLQTGQYMTLKNRQAQRLRRSVQVNMQIPNASNE